MRGAHSSALEQFWPVNIPLSGVVRGFIPRGEDHTSHIEAWSSQEHRDHMMAVERDRTKAFAICRPSLAFRKPV